MGINKAMWNELKLELIDRLKSPISSPPFILYFIFSIVFAGVIGLIATVYIENKLTNEIVGHLLSHIHISLAFSSYSVALLTACCTDLLLSSSESETKNSFLMIGVGSLLLGLFLMFGVLGTEQIPLLGYLFAILGIILSWFIWWISNSRHPHLIITPKNAIPTAGILSGNDSNFNL